jgi:pyrimidine operon attenuation protein/uracil phosphoribosyltransferase
MFGTWRTPVRVCDEPLSFAKRELGRNPTVRSVPGPSKCSESRSSASRRRATCQSCSIRSCQGCGGIGLVEAADVDDVLPEPLERLVGVEIRVDDLRPAAGRVGRERPRDRPVVDRLERLLDRRQSILSGARRVDAVEQPGRDHRHEDAARCIELPEGQDPLAEPRRHPVERAVARPLRTDPLHVAVEVLDVDVARALLVRPPRDCGDERLRLGQRLDCQDLVGLDVRPDGDDQIRVAVEQLRVHPAGTILCAPSRTPLSRSSEAGKESDDVRPSPRDACCAMSAVEASRKILLDADALARTLSRIAHEIIEANPNLDEVALVGIQTRGVPLAQRLARLIEERAGRAPELGAVDITFYRDDVRVRGGEAPLHAQPVVRETQLDFALDGRTVVLVDDVLYTGRTIRAAIEALFDYGRPSRVQLAVIVDRGHRELPIRPDYVGKNLPTARSERIQVQLVEVDEVDRILLVPNPEEGSR